MTVHRTQRISVIKSVLSLSVQTVHPLLTNTAVVAFLLHYSTARSTPFVTTSPTPCTPLLQAKDAKAANKKKGKEKLKDPPKLDKRTFNHSRLAGV